MIETIFDPTSKQAGREKLGQMGDSYSPSNACVSFNADD